MLRTKGPGQQTTWAVLLGLLLICTVTAVAQLPIPPSSQFDITGFLQSATLTTPGDAHSGGTLQVNGHTIIVPRETIVILPANALTWEELFAQAPAPYGPSQTGMAMNDLPTPLTTYEVHVVGNRVLGGAGGADVYIAGLVDVSQQGLNSGAGFINYMDYAAGEMRVGGVLGDPTTGARVRINDPNGRYGRNTTSPDIRFTVDPDNPTIAAGSGYPMCFPRTDPAVADDPLCPQGNRPVLVDGTHATNFTTNNLTNPNFAATPAFPNSSFQAPFEVGDYVTFSGTLVQDCATCPGGGTTAGPYPAAGASATYISAHTISNNVAIYTFPGSNPAYVATEVTLIGTGGLTVLGAGEAAIRTRFEGMMTDPSRVIYLYGIDLNPANGSTSDRYWGQIGVDPGPATGAVKGRWRFRPPCLAFGSVPTKPDKECIYGPSGTFLPPTREVRAVIVDPATLAPANPGMTATASNGLIYGQYHAPILEYIFPENVPGSPIVENNFNSIDFLAKGGYTSSAGTVAGVLNPWPSNILPVAVCVPPTANAGGPYSAASGGTITLNGSASGSTPMTFAWTATGGTFADPTLAAASYTAPASASSASYALSLTATNACGSNVANSSVTVNGATGPTASVPAPQTVISGSPVTLKGTGTDPNVPALPVSFTWTQTNFGAPGVPSVFGASNTFTCAQAASPIQCAVSFIVSVPLGQIAPITIQLKGVATNSVGVSSAAAFTSVTFNPTPEPITITAAEYRTGKQRLIVNATDSIISPNIVLTLAPYLTESGTIFDPATLGNTFTNNGGGLYIIDLVGAPRPACNLGGAYATPCSQASVVVKSNTGGVATSALTRIRN